MALFGDKAAEAAIVKADDNGGGEDPKPVDIKPSCVVINIYCGECCDKKES